MTNEVTTEYLISLAEKGFSNKQIAERPEVQLDRGTVARRFRKAEYTRPEPADRPPDNENATQKRGRVPAASTERIVELHTQGLSDTQIGRELGMKRNAVYQRLRYRKLIDPDVVPTERLVELWESGMDAEEIAEEEGIDLSERQVRDRLRRAGADVPEIPSPAEMKRLYEQGLTEAEVAQQTRVSISTAHRYLVAADVQFRPAGQTTDAADPEITARMARMFNEQYMTPYEISLEIGMSLKWVRQHLRDAGVDLTGH